jgi:hypothetical protein
VPEPDEVSFTIEEFFGDVANEEEVLNSKISEEEKKRLDAPLTLVKLDKSMKKAKINSSPGIDGISNRFIREFWEFFRIVKFGKKLQETADEEAVWGGDTWQCGEQQL